MNLLKAQNLKKTFGHIVAVDDISLSLDIGEVVGFLGPNGAGKSTTMKMLTGFLEPDEGSVFIKKLNLHDHPLKSKSFMGYLPEGAPAYSDMTVSSFLNFIGLMRGLKDSLLINRLKEMSDQINLNSVWDQPIETLSKGYKRSENSFDLYI